MLEIPQIEHLISVEQFFGAQCLEHLLGQDQRGDRGLVLFEQSPLFQGGEYWRRDERLQQRTVQDRAAADFIWFVPDQVVFEQREEKIFEECAEVRDQAFAGLGKIAYSCRTCDNLTPCPAVVAVIFQPQVARR